MDIVVSLVVEAAEYRGRAYGASPQGKVEAINRALGKLAQALAIAREMNHRDWINNLETLERAYEAQRVGYVSARDAKIDRALARVGL